MRSLKSLKFPIDKSFVPTSASNQLCEWMNHDLPHFNTSIFANSKFTHYIQLWWLKLNKSTQHCCLPGRDSLCTTSEYRVVQPVIPGLLVRSPVHVSKCPFTWLCLCSCTCCGCKKSLSLEGTNKRLQNSIAKWNERRDMSASHLACTHVSSF